MKFRYKEVDNLMLLYPASSLMYYSGTGSDEYLLRGYIDFICSIKKPVLINIPTRLDIRMAFGGDGRASYTILTKEPPKPKKAWWKLW